MAKDPAFLFYPGDWLGGTLGMTFEQKGAYMELLMLQFNRGHMTEDMIRHTVGQLWVNLKDKFRLDDQGLWFNKRLEEEKESRKFFVESRRNNVSGHNQYTNKEGHTNGHMTSHMEDEDVNEDISKNKKGVEGEKYQFEIFWDSYDKRVGRKKSEAKWKKLSEKEKEAILNFIQKYKISQPDKQYRQNPETFFNNRTWEDEIINTANAIKPTPYKSSWHEANPNGRMY